MEDYKSAGEDKKATPKMRTSGGSDAGASDASDAEASQEDSTNKSVTKSKT